MFDDSIRKARLFTRKIPAYSALDKALSTWVQAQDWYNPADRWPWQFTGQGRKPVRGLIVTPSLATWIERVALENPLSHIQYNRGRPSNCLSFVVLCNKLGISPLMVQERIYKRRAVEAADAMFLQKDYEVSPATVGAWMQAVTGATTLGTDKQNFS